MYEHILLATDASPSSGPATASAQDLAQRLGSELIIMHVREMDFGAEAFRQDPSRLDRIVADLQSQGIRARAMLVDAPKADIGSEVVRAAGLVGADMIIVGARGLGELGSLISGSETRRVLHEARVPVLVLHE